MKAIITAVLILTAAIHFDALAQVALINPQTACLPHESTYYFSANFERAEDTAVGGTLGFVKGRTVDVGLAIGKLSTNTAVVQGLDLSVIHISPHLTFFPISQRDAMPVTIGLTAGYSAIKFASPLLTQANVSINASDVDFQLNVFSRFPVSPVTSFILGGSVVYLSRTFRASSPVGGIQLTVSDVGFNIHGDFKFSNAGNSFFYCGPKFTVFDNTTSIALTAGVGFGSTRNEMRSAYRNDADFDAALEDPEPTRLPNFRKARGESQKYTDEQILAMFRRKFPSAKDKSDEELVELIERKYREKSEQN
jgi:hypothetical protein